jgi:hypothetical protein
MARSLADLRSRRWFAAGDMRGFAHRQRIQQMGLRREDVLERPIVAIINTWSDLSPCHAHLRERAEAIKRGVLLAGGMPFELPAMSLGEVMVKPTTMLYRNFLAMEVEELLRSLPVDGVVLLAGCDKTTPGTVMGAISMDLPTLFCPAGGMLSDRYLKPGEPSRAVGAGTHTRMFWDEYQAGAIGAEEWIRLESRLGALVKVVLPLAAPGLFTAGILAFVNAWDEFLLALSLNASASMRTVPVGITLYQGEFAFPWPIISAALVVAIVPVAVLVALFQERVVGGLTQGGLKG